MKMNQWRNSDLEATPSFVAPQTFNVFETTVLEHGSSMCSDISIRNKIRRFL